MQQPYERLALIGLGLIGSSIGHVAKRDGLARHIVGHSRTAATREAALRIGFVDSVAETPEEAAAGADLVILCTPVGTYADIAASIGPHLQPGATVSDVGSVKTAVVRDVGPHIPEGVHFIPAHPVAGTEYSGPEAGFATLFEDRYCILTPAPGSDSQAVERLSDFWASAGSRVELMEPRHHDRVLAVTSHVPHLIAYTIVGTASDLEEQLRREKAENDDIVEMTEVIKYSAGGFRDFTRIAASDPVMWRDIFLNNREAVIEILGRFVEDMTALQRAIRWGEGDTLEAHFVRTRAIRRGVIEMGQAGSFQPNEPDNDKSS